MKKFLLLFTLLLMVIPVNPAYSFNVSPSLNSNTTYTSSGFSAGEDTVIAGVKTAMADRITKLELLDKAYPGTGFGSMASSMRSRLNAVDKAGMAKGSTLWGQTPAYVSAGNTVCLTGNFFDNSKYGTEERIALLAHEGVHLDQYRAYRYGSNFINGASLGFISKPSETNSYIEEYKTLRILGCKIGSFEVQNVLQALVEQGVIPSTDSSDVLDNSLGLQKAFHLASQGLDNIGADSQPAGSDTGANSQSVTLGAGQKIILSGSSGEKYFNVIPGENPASVGWEVTAQVPGPGKITYRAGHSTNSATSGPRYYGDELGYRSQASVYFSGAGVSSRGRFSNGYDKNYSYITGSFDFSAADTLKIRFIPQGARAYYNTQTKNKVPVSDGDGYLYFDAAFTLELSFEPAGGSGTKGIPANTTGGIQVLLDGKRIQSDVPPTMENGRTLLPLRAVFEALGATVGYENGRVTAVSGNTAIELTIGSQTALVNGSPVIMDVPPKLVNNRTMVPVRFVAEALGRKVNWDEGSQSVLIQ